MVQRHDQNLNWCKIKPEELDEWHLQTLDEQWHANVIRQQHKEVSIDHNHRLPVSPLLCIVYGAISRSTDELQKKLLLKPEGQLWFLCPVCFF